MKTVEEFSADITEAIKKNGSYTHNLIGMLLRGCAKAHGTAAANQLIDDHDLEMLGFNKENDEQE